MKPAWEWTEQDILDLITNGVGEDLNLEYKWCDALLRTDRSKTEISKDVSSFANSAGGTIVYGVVDDKHVPTAIDEGHNPRGEITKEWLENVITSTIRPRIDGVRINPVALTSTHPGRVLYVVYIPQSKRPHQANDHRFYKRFNFKAAPMEEYEIWDVARRNEAPDLNLTFNLWKPGLVPHGEYIDVDQPGGKARLFSLLNNTSDEPAFYIDIRILLDPRFNVPDAAGLTHIGNRLYRGNSHECLPVALVGTFANACLERIKLWYWSDYRIAAIDGR
jgi:hypothetical protein